MIGYTMVGTNDLKRASTFYDALFGAFGKQRILEDGNFVAWGSTLAEPAFSVTKPYDGNPAMVGNGVMIALRMDSKEQVDAFYSKAMELGASDEGPPGQRDEGFYAGYFRDPDGNKLNAFVMG